MRHVITAGRESPAKGHQETRRTCGYLSYAPPAYECDTRPFLTWVLFVAASHQTGLDTRSKVRRPIKVGIRGREGRERVETRTLLVCAAHRPFLRWVLSQGRGLRRALKKGLLILRRCYDTLPQPREYEILL